MDLILTSDYVLIIYVFDVFRLKYYKRAVVSRDLDSGHVPSLSVVVGWSTTCCARVTTIILRSLMHEPIGYLKSHQRTE